jgi:carbonic anhydrase
VGAYHDIATRTVHFGTLVTADDFDRYRDSATGLAA